MDQEKFVNVYIELLNATLAEAIQKNVVAQAKNRVFEEDVAEYGKRISEKDNSNREILQQKEAQIQSLTSQLNDARRQLGAASTKLEEIKTSSEHFETYKNELMTCRLKNEELMDLIRQKDELIAKKDKKLEEFGVGPKPVVVNKLAKKTVPLETKEEKSKTIKVKTVKDAGSF